MLKGEEIKYIINHAEAKIFLNEDTLIANDLAIKKELRKTYE